MATTDTSQGAIIQRDRSPSFPFIPLKTAIERLVAFEEFHKRVPVSPDRLGPAWGMKNNSSQAQQTLAALKAYGLMESQRVEAGRVVVITDEGRRYLRSAQDSIKQDVLRRAALRPKQIETHWRAWGKDRPADPACLDVLVFQEDFSPDGASKFLRVYDDTIAFARLGDSDKIPSDEVVEDQENGENPPPLSQVKLGDYVQWTSGGIDQFKVPRKIIGFLDAEHVQVFGSNTGIAVSELTVVGAPGAPSETVAPARVEAASAMAQGENDFNVLQRGNRLQITADVDLEGLATLKEMLGDYESILRRLAAKKIN